MGASLLAVFGLLMTQGVTLVAGQCQGAYQAIAGHTACLSRVGSVVSAGILQADRDDILDKHNMLRGGVTNPTASDMIHMAWDDEIAMIAQKWAEQCSLSHDVGYNRHVPGIWPSVGQNLAWGYGTWDAAIQGWYDEVNDFNYNSPNQNGMVGHYTAVVWANSATVGCGFALCGSTPYYACNYGPSGNLFTSAVSQYVPYSAGIPCSDCGGTCINNNCYSSVRGDGGGRGCEVRADATYTIPEHKACKNCWHSKVCDKICYNGGTLDLGSCTCTCPGNLYDPENCALDCTQNIRDPDYCLGQYGRAACSQFSNVPGECPSMCGACEGGGIITTTTGAPTTPTTTITEPTTTETTTTETTTTETTTQPTTTTIAPATTSTAPITITTDSPTVPATPDLCTRNPLSSACEQTSDLVISEGVSESDKEAILSYHNFQRSFVSPMSSDMKTLKWDSDLAASAQGWASTCNPANDLPVARVVPGMFDNVFQNAAFDSASFDDAMFVWSSQSNQFTYGDDSVNIDEVRTYVQMIWADNYRIGCGHASCDDQAGGVRHHIICNYAPGGDVLSAYATPYTLGLSCDGCDNCDIRTCDCGEKICLNNGVLNNQCECECLSSTQEPLFNCAEITTTPAPTTVFTTQYPEQECGCPSVHVTGPGLFREDIGIYTVEACQVAGRPVYKKVLANGENRYVYFDETEQSWLLQTDLEAGDTVFRSPSTAQRPYYVDETWEYRDAFNGYTASEAIDVVCMCQKPECEEYTFESDNLAHTFPATFVKQGGKFNNRPYYRMSANGQTVFLYFQGLSGGQCSVWRVGEAVGDNGVMVTYDVSSQPYDIKSPWQVAGTNNDWLEDPTLSLTCLRFP